VDGNKCAITPATTHTPLSSTPQPYKAPPEPPFTHHPSTSPPARATVPFMVKQHGPDPDNRCNAIPSRCRGRYRRLQPRHAAPTPEPARSPDSTDTKPSARPWSTPTALTAVPAIRCTFSTVGTATGSLCLRPILTGSRLWQCEGEWRIDFRITVMQTWHDLSTS